MTTSIQNYEQNTALQQAINRPENTTLVPYLKAIGSPKVADSSDVEILVRLNGVVTTSVFELGQQPKDSGEVELIIKALMPDVKLFFKNLTLGELSLAAHRGALGNYGEFFGINVVTLTTWFNAFMGDMKRQEAKRLLLEDSPPNIERTLNDNDRACCALEAFEKFKATGRYEDWGNLVYNYLDSSGLITFSNDRKAEMKTQVMQSEIERMSTPTSLDEKRDFDRKISALLEGRTDIKAKCKRHALNVYFAELVETGQELKELFNAE